MMKIDERDDWSDEDLADATLSSLQYAELSDMQAEFAGWSLLSDDDLGKIAQSTFDKTKRATLEELIERQKRQVLSVTEQTTLEQLLLESQELIVRKAEAQRLLAQRGYLLNIRWRKSSRKVCPDKLRVRCNLPGR